MSEVNVRIWPEIIISSRFQAK